MGRIIVTEFISLDGVIEASGGGEDYRYGGWTFEIDRGEEGNQFKLDETMGSAALLLGRRTYEGFAAAWPERDGEFADKVNTMPKYVVSSTLRDPEWTNSTVLSGDMVDEITKLKEEQDGDIVVHGLPGRARQRQAAVRRDHRQEAAAAGRHQRWSVTALPSRSTRAPEPVGTWRRAPERRVADQDADHRRGSGGQRVAEGGTANEDTADRLPG